MRVYRMHTLNMLIADGVGLAQHCDAVRGMTHERPSHAGPNAAADKDTNVFIGQRFFFRSVTETR